MYVNRFNGRQNGMYVQPMQAPNFSLYGLEPMNMSPGIEINPHQPPGFTFTPRANSTTPRTQSSFKSTVETLLNNQWRQMKQDNMSVNSSSPQVCSPPFDEPVPRVPTQSKNSSKGKYQRSRIKSTPTKAKTQRAKTMKHGKPQTQRKGHKDKSVVQPPGPSWPRSNQHFSGMSSVFSSPVNDQMMPRGHANEWSLNKQPCNGREYKFASDRYEQELQEAILRSKCESTQPKVQTEFGDDKAELSDSDESDDDDSDDDIQSRSTTVNVNRLNGRIFEDQIEVELRRSKKITSFERRVPCYSHRRTGYADFVIKPKSGKKVVIEAKNFDGNPIQAKNVRQVYKYAKYLHAKPKLLVSNTTVMPPSEAIKRLAKRKKVVIQKFDKFKKYLQD